MKEIIKLLEDIDSIKGDIQINQRSLKDAQGRREAFNKTGLGAVSGMHIINKEIAEYKLVKKANMTALKSTLKQLDELIIINK